MAKNRSEHINTLEQISDKNTSYFPLCWLIHRDPFLWPINGPCFRRFVKNIRNCMASQGSVGNDLQFSPKVLGTQNWCTVPYVRLLWGWGFLYIRGTYSLHILVRILPSILGTWNFLVSIYCSRIFFASTLFHKQAPISQTGNTFPETTSELSQLKKLPPKPPKSLELIISWLEKSSNCIPIPNNDFSGEFLWWKECKKITSMPRKEAGKGVFHPINFEECPPLDITRNLGGKHNHQFQPL